MRHSPQLHTTQAHHAAPAFRPVTSPLVSQYLLVVTTEVAVQLYALTFDGDSVHGALHIRETGYTVPTGTAAARSDRC